MSHGTFEVRTLLYPSMLWLLAAVAQIVALPTALDARWVAALDTPPIAPAAYDADRVYVPVRGSVVALDLGTGRVIWRREVTTAIAPTAGLDAVFIATDAGVESIEAATGVTRWHTPLPGRLTIVSWDTGWLLCGTEAGDLAALRASDGELVWRTALGSRVDTPPEPALDRLYLGLDGARVMSIELATGRVVWERTLTGRLTGLSATGDQLIVGSTGREVASLDLRSGRVRWRWRVGGAAAGRAAGDDRRIYVVARDNVLRAVDRESGNLRWYAELGARPTGGPALLGGAVLVPLTSTVEVFEPSTGKNIGAIAVEGEIAAPPYVRLDTRPTDVRLIAATRDGRIQGFGVRYEPPRAPLAVLPGAPALP
jgi:outer membrane protein assembly factor BamB